MYAVLADLVALFHAAIALFIVLGLVFIVYGLLRRRAWARHLLLRTAHLGISLIVLAFEAFNQPCPLTTLEQWCRAQAGQRAFDGSFIAHYVSKVLHLEVEPRALAVPTAVWVFGIVVLYFLAGPSRHEDRAAPNSSNDSSRTTAH